MIRNVLNQAERDPIPEQVPVLNLVAPSTRGSIRSFERRDIPQICRLFSQTFRLGGTYRADDLAACLEATYFQSPAYTERTGAIVHLDEMGAIDGFMGVIAMTMVVEGRTLRAGILSAYMASDPDSNPGIGVSLVRGVTARGFDLLFTDTANRTSLDISRATRFVVLPAQSLEWVQVLRPAGTAVYFLGKRLPRLASAIVPLARAADTLVRRFLPVGTVRHGGLAGVRSRPLATADFAEAAGHFLESYDLKPDWTGLTWFVEQAALQTKYGPLQIREVLDRIGRRVGLYLLYARRDGVAYALQVLATRNREELVIARMLADAAEIGAVAVRGATSPDLMKGLFRQKGIFYHHVMGTIAWTRDPDVAAILRNGNVFLGGLAGETWARIVTEDFS